MFNSKHPIICAPMNYVYSYEFACACLDADITYGFFNRMVPEHDIKKLVSMYGPDRFFATLHLNNIDIHSIKKFMGCGIKHIEVPDAKQKVNSDFIKYLQKNNYTLYCKPSNQYSKYIDLFSGIVVKGGEAAARSNKNPLANEFKNIKQKYAGKHLIASGGIHNAEMVDYYIAMGAQAVSIGTMFAASAESPLSAEAKQQIINTNRNKLTRFSNSQQALVFSEQSEDDENNTSSLKKGIQTGKQGHLFAGHAVDHITKIKSVAEIVADLT